MPHDPFSNEQIVAAWFRCGGRCECCGKVLTPENQGRESGWGSWEAHYAPGRFIPVILCTGYPENCHLNCGHWGNYQNTGVVPQVHLGG